MTRATRYAGMAVASIAAAALLASAATAQNNGGPRAADSARTMPTPQAAPSIFKYRPIEIQYLRPSDQRGLNYYESPKTDTLPYRGFVVRFGGAFVQDFQGLTHENTAAPKVVGGVNANQLMTIGNGFNNSVANLFIDAQIADGMRVSMTSYLSARHHNETWVKDGYLQVDKSPIDNPVMNAIMEKLTIRFGQFEVNYGDAHFRRTDNGNGMFNPFVGNLIMDAQTTEIGAEFTFKHDGWIAMAGITNAESKGLVTAPAKRTAAYLGKVGFDRNFDSLRVRLTGSFYTTSSANNNVLYSGDRGGSRYYYVMENTSATDVAQAWSGLIQPGFGHNVLATVINPFVKYEGWEFNGHFESAKGHAWTETDDRTWTQNAVEGLYRFWEDKLYVGGRWNNAKGTLATTGTNDLTVERVQVGGGWFLNPHVLLKLELVDQKYSGFPTTDIRNGGRFKGFMVEGLVGF